MECDNGCTSIIKKKDYSKPLSEKEENELIENFNNLKFFDPKVDTLFKIIFGSEDNKDIAISLLLAVLPEKEEIQDIDIKTAEVHSQRYDPFLRKITVDIFAKKKITEKKETNENKKTEKTEEKEIGAYYIIEMQIHEISDTLGRAELSTSRLFNSLYTSGERIILKEKIYSINFLYYDQYPSDKDYYHILFTHEYKKKNISLPFKTIILIELKKFKENFDLSKITNVNIHDRKIVRQLWFALLSHINTLYHKPSNVDPSKYLIIEKNKKGNKDQNENGNEKTIIYIKNEITKDLYKKLIKIGTIRKALDLCINLSESVQDKYINDVETDIGLLYELENKDNIIKEKDEKLKENEETIKEKDETIKEKDEKLKENEETIKEKDERIEQLLDEINMIRKQANKNNNDIQNSKKSKRRKKSKGSKKSKRRKKSKGSKKI